MKIIGAIIAIFICAAACVSIVGANATTGTGSRTVYGSTPTTQAAATTPTLVPGTIPSGEWLVGTEVAPGLYRSAGPSEQFITYCQVTTEDANGKMLEWKNSGNAGEGLMIRVSPNAKTVRNNNCAPFTKVG